MKQERTQDCETILELIPAYSIGATDPAENAFIKANLAKCPEAAAELAEYMTLTESLHYAAPLYEPPPTLGVELMAALDTSRRSPVQPFTRKMMRLRLRPVAYAAAVLLVAFNLYLVIQVEALNRSRQAATAALDEQTATLAMIGSGRAIRLALSSQNPDQPMKPGATLLCDPNGSLGLLYVEHFPQLPADHAYQVWLTDNGKTYSVDLFNVGDDGSGTVIIKAPAIMRDFETIGITAEPVLGSDAPTTPSLIHSTLYSSDTN